jgi:cell division protein FtsB
MRRTGIIFLILVYLGIMAGRGIHHNYVVIKRHKALQSEIALQTKINADLKNRLQKLKDPEYLELLARQKLGLVKAGEIVYKVAEQQ